MIRIIVKSVGNLNNTASMFIDEHVKDRSSLNKKSLKLILKLSCVNIELFADVIDFFKLLEKSVLNLAPIRSLKVLQFSLGKFPFQ